MLHALDHTVEIEHPLHMPNVPELALPSSISLFRWKGRLIAMFSRMANTPNGEFERFSVLGALPMAVAVELIELLDAGVPITSELVEVSPAQSLVAIRVSACEHDIQRARAQALTIQRPEIDVMLRARSAQEFGYVSYDPDLLKEMANF